MDELTLVCGVEMKPLSPMLVDIQKAFFFRNTSFSRTELQATW